MNKNLVKAGKLQETLFFELKKILIRNITFFEIYDFITLYYSLNSLEIIPNSIPVTINLNNTVYHGRPGAGYIKDGDIVTIDVCYSYKDIKIDGASTFSIGSVSNVVSSLIDVNKEAIKGVLNIIDIGVSVKDIIKFLSDFISDKGYYILPHGMGHGIGEFLHQKPFISLNDFTDFDYKFKKGDIFTIEPIILLERDKICENIIGEGMCSSGNISSQFEIMIYLEDYNSLKIINEALIK